MSFPLYHVIEKQTLVSFNISSPSTCFFHCILTVNLNLCTCIYVDSKDALIEICDYAYVSIQLMPALKVNIVIVHPRGVVFPEGKQHPKGEQL